MTRARAPQTTLASTIVKSSEVRRSLPEHAANLHRRARRLCRNDSEARDLVQDTLERALCFESRFEPSSNLGAWLHRILLRVFLTQCRRGRRERRAFALLRDDPCAWTSPEALPTGETLSAPALRALALLPASFREAVQLVDVMGCSYRDAASILGVPTGTIMSRVHRGRRMLAEVWAPRETLELLERRRAA
jgi:RNA polymerase sigma-70 factor (ECF subfamily)